MSETSRVPSSILIIGSGVFGLATAWSLAQNPVYNNTTITLVDRLRFPAPDGSSIDASRIIRPDYAAAPYARLASLAQERWRNGFAPGTYRQTGLCVTADGPGQEYLSSSMANVLGIGKDEVEVLESRNDVRRVCGVENRDARASGSMGYVNWSSGWADAEAAMRWVRTQVEQLHRVRFVVGTVKKLLIQHSTNTVSGALLADDSRITADLTILAAGAWSPALLDLRGICNATGQPLAYLPITAAEEAALSHRPTILNLSNALFIIPPANGLLKVARHGHGYTNQTTIPHPESSEPNATITVSLPYTHVDDPALAIPDEAHDACRSFLASLHPSIATPARPFTKSRICWYTDTRSGDFLVDYHPQYAGLFVCTGGSGHAFKFLPVIGDVVVQCLQGKTPDEFRERWKWPADRLAPEEWLGDGSRGGPKGLVLKEELGKMRRGKL